MPNKRKKVKIQKKDDVQKKQGNKETQEQNAHGRQKKSESVIYAWFGSGVAGAGS